jgi:hypothetical protein
VSSGGLFQFRIGSQFVSIYFGNLPANPPPMTKDPNDNKLMTKRVPLDDRTVINITYPASEARDLRSLVASFTLKAGKRASLALIARRSLYLYRQLLADPSRIASEVLALNEMTTRTPQPAPLSKRKAAM